AFVLLLRAALLDEADGLAHAVAQVEELCPAVLAAAADGHLRDERRMQREDALDAFVVDDAPDGEGFVDPRPLLHDHRAGEDLNAFLVAFDDAGRHVHRVTDVELRRFFLQVRLFYAVDDSVPHGISDPPPQISSGRLVTQSYCSSRSGSP